MADSFCELMKKLGKNAKLFVYGAMKGNEFLFQQQKHICAIVLQRDLKLLCS